MIHEPVCPDCSSWSMLRLLLLALLLIDWPQASEGLVGGALGSIRGDLERQLNPTNIPPR